MNNSMSLHKRRKNRTFQKNRAKQNNDWMWELIFQKVKKGCLKKCS